MLLRPYQKADWPRLRDIHDEARLDELRSSNLEEAFLTLALYLAKGFRIAKRVGGRLNGNEACTASSHVLVCAAG